MTTNNTHLKTIAEKVTETEISGTHPDNYYLKLICTTYGYTYTGTVCDGKLIKDFASAVTSKTYNRIHFDNKYYHDIAESLTGNTYDNKYDNFYLGIIAENIAPPTPMKKLDHINVELIAGNQILSYTDEQRTPDSQYATVRFTAYADVEETETIPNLSLDFKVGSGAVTSVVTDSNGRYEYTYHSLGMGDVEISASKTVEGSLVSKTFAIEDCWKYDNATSDNTSKYDTSGLSSNTFSYSSQDQSYIMVNNSAFEKIVVDGLTVPLDTKLTVDFKYSVSGTNKNFQSRPIIINTSTNEYVGVTIHYEKWGTSSAYSHFEMWKGENSDPNSSKLGDNVVSFSDNTWYTLELTVETSTITAKVYNGSTLVSTLTASNSVLSTTSAIGILTGHSNSTLYWKNLKIKPL